MSDRPSVSLSMALPRPPAPRAAGRDRRPATPERGSALRAGLPVAGLGGMDWRRDGWVGGKPVVGAGSQSGGYEAA